MYVLGNPEGERWLDGQFCSDEPRLPPDVEETLLSFAQEIAKTLGLEDPCLAFFSQDVGNMVGLNIGMAETPTIILTAYHHRTDCELLETVAHELAHAYQSRMYPSVMFEDEDLMEDQAETFAKLVSYCGLPKAVNYLNNSVDECLKEYVFL